MPAPPAPAPAPAALVAPLLAPVPGERPAGRDLRYDPRYDRLREARREDADLPQGALAVERKLADWPLAVTLATQLLEREAKDLQLAAWLTEAWLRRHGPAGLAAGLDLLRGLLDQYWDTLHPELEDGDAELRVGPLEWVGAKLDLAVRQVAVTRDGLPFVDYAVSRGVPTEQEAADDRDRRAAREAAVGEGKPTPEACDARVTASPKEFYRTLTADLDAALAALAALDAAGDARFGGDAPAYTRLRGALDEVRRFAAATLARKLELDPDPVEPPPPDAPDGDVPAEAVGSYAPPAGWAAGDGAPNGAPNGAPAAPTGPAAAAAQVAAAAQFLRRADPAAPAPYLLLRALRWGELRATPGRLDPALLEAPPTAMRSRLKALLLEGRWADLLEQGEQVMAAPYGRGWLDLQRYTVTACARLGPAYRPVADAVRAELGALLDALPGLPEVTLMDDTPTANAETRAWLRTLRPDGGRGDAYRNGADGDGDGDDEARDDGAAALAAALGDEDAGDALAAGSRGAARPRAAGYDAFGPAPDPFELARAELARGRATAAVELLVGALDRERSARGRFVRQTQVAHVMVEAGLEAVARPILERLLEVIEERALADWESGPLVAHPLALMCRVLDKLELDEDARAEHYLKVCRLDPLQAIALRPRA